MEFSLSTKTLYALFSDELSCFFQFRGSSHQSHHTGRRVLMKCLIFLYELWGIFVNVWGGRFWWLTGCAVRTRQNKEKEARTSYWKDTGGMIQMFSINWRWIKIFSSFTSNLNSTRLWIHWLLSIKWRIVAMYFSLLFCQRGGEHVIKMRNVWAICGSRKICGGNVCPVFSHLFFSAPCL